MCVFYMHPAASNALKYTQVQDDTRQGVTSTITKYLYLEIIRNYLHTDK